MLIIVLASSFSVLIVGLAYVFYRLLADIFDADREADKIRRDIERIKGR